MQQDLAKVLDDLVVRAQLARLEHADRAQPPADQAREAQLLEQELVLGGLGAAASEANDLTSEPEDGPAATLFAFGRRRYLFPQGHRSMTFLLTAARARDLGRRLVIGDEELCAMLERLSGKRPPGFAELSAWLGPRLVARGAEEDERLPRAV